MATRTTSVALRTLFAGIPHNIRVFAFCDLLGNFARAMVYPYASLYILALGGNTAQIGLIQSLIPLMGLVILPIAGYLAGLFAFIIPYILRKPSSRRSVVWAVLLCALLGPALVACVAACVVTYSDTAEYASADEAERSLGDGGEWPMLQP